MFSRKVCYEMIKYLLFFLLFYILSVAEIEGIRPFAFGMFFALIWCNQKLYLIAPIYFLSGILADFSINTIISLAGTCIVFSIFYLLHLRLKKPLNAILIGVYAFLSQFAFLYLNIQSAEQIISASITVIVGLVCMYAYLYFMQSLILQGVRRRFTLDEVISAGVLLVSIGAGISNIPDFYGIFAKILLIFSTLLFVWIFNTSTSISFSILLGLGASLGADNVLFFLDISLISLIANLTRSEKKFFCCLSIILVDLFVNLYFFDNYNAYMLLSSLIASVLFLLVPNKTLHKLSNVVISDSDDFALRNMINRSRKILYKRIWGISEVFLEMQNVFMSMAKNIMSPEDSISFVANETRKNVCENCSRKNDCWRVNLNKTTKEIENLAALSLARGRVNVLDVPSGLSTKCQKLSVLIGGINSASKDFNSYTKNISGMNESRILIADQLYGVSQILKSLAEEVNLNINFDAVKERKIIEELSAYHILCSEAVIYFQNKEIKSVSLIVRKSDANRKEISEIVGKILNCKMEISSVAPSEKSGYLLLVLKTKVFYDMIFGSAGVTKNGGKVSGDTHSVMRVGEDKIMMALCDGMGSGSSAEKVSSLALGLVENFYKAGFESLIILSNVNKLISMKGEENFSALDICVFDLRQNICDLVKLGSPMGFLKRKDETIIIDAGSLPLGILDDVRPCFKSYALCDEDMVILITDGVLDAFGDFESLNNFIAESKILNPQVLAEKIIEEALVKCHNCAPDDMTILIGKVWRKI